MRKEYFMYRTFPVALETDERRTRLQLFVDRLTDEEVLEALQEHSAETEYGFPEDAKRYPEEYQEKLAEIAKEYRRKLHNIVQEYWDVGKRTDVARLQSTGVFISGGCMSSRGNTLTPGYCLLEKLNGIPRLDDLIEMWGNYDRVKKINEEVKYHV